MKFHSVSVAVVTATLCFGIGAAVSPVAHAAGFVLQQAGWDTPPGEYNQYRQQGFRDGIEGARKDAENHRSFTPENRDEYRHPHVPKNVYGDYREAFREGYNRAVTNLHYRH